MTVSFMYKSPQSGLEFLVETKGDMPTHVFSEDLQCNVYFKALHPEDQLGIKKEIFKFCDRSPDKTLLEQEQRGRDLEVLRNIKQVLQ